MSEQQFTLSVRLPTRRWVFRLLSICVATIGAGCVLASYARYRWLAGPFPAYSYYWPLVGAYLVGPFLLVVLGSMGARTAQVGWSIFAGACVLSTISLLESLVPIEPPFKDAEIPAAMILEGVSCVQYIVGIILLLLGWSEVELMESGSIPGIENTQDSPPT